MSALKFSGVVLPDGEARDLYVVDGSNGTKRVTYEKQAGAETAANGYIVPGLVDAHCHVGLGEFGEASYEETLEMALEDRDCGALLLRDCGAVHDTRWVQEREDLPRLIRAGRHIARSKRYMRGFADEVEPEGLVEATVREAGRGDGWVKLVGDWIDRDTGDLDPSFPAWDFAAAIAAAPEVGAKVTAHCFGVDVLEGLIDAGIDCIEHGTGLREHHLPKMVAQGTALVPTVAQLELFPILAEQAGPKFPKYGATMDDLYAHRRETIMNAYEAGVTMYAGSDGAKGRRHGVLPEEIRAMVEVGLPVDYVLGAASWRAREWLGFTPDLREGAEADFIVYPRNPLDDPSVVFEPTAIVLRGNVVSA